MLLHRWQVTKCSDEFIDSTLSLFAFLRQPAYGESFPCHTFAQGRVAFAIDTLLSPIVTQAMVAGAFCTSGQKYAIGQIA